MKGIVVNDRDGLGMLLVSQSNGNLTLVVLRPVKGYAGSAIKPDVYSVQELSLGKSVVLRSISESTNARNIYLPSELLPTAILAELLWQFRPDDYIPRHGGSPTPHHGGNV